METTTEEIAVDWTALTQPMAFSVGTHRRRIRAARVPVIFVPGIMGSRLTSADGTKTVWDPDGLPQFLWNHAFAHGQAARPGLFGLSSLPARHLLQIAGDFSVEARLLGFEQLVQRFYAEFKGYMDGALGCKPPLLQLCFDTPLFAAAYNWVDSPLAAALEVSHRVRQIVNHFRSRGQICPGVVLVTHSMGGLIARAAAKLFVPDIAVLGMVHVGQPTLGAPAAYARMKAGNLPQDGSWEADWGAGVLGRTGQEVTALMGRMSGALSLLPQPRGGTAWLSIDSRLQPLPLREDQLVAQVFREQHLPWGLADPALLRLGTDSVEQGFAAFLSALDGAQVFHDKLGAWAHQNTFHVVGTEVPTVEKIEFRATRPQASPGCWPKDVGHGSSRWERHYGMGQFWAEGLGPQGGTGEPWRVVMEQKFGDGDGTVPVSSALGGLTGPADEARVTRVPGAQHDSLMRDARVQKAVFERIVAVLRQYFFEASQ